AWPVTLPRLPDSPLSGRGARPEILLHPLDPPPLHVALVDGIGRTVSVHRIGDELGRHAIVPERVEPLERFGDRDAIVARVVQDEGRGLDLARRRDRRLRHCPLHVLRTGPGRVRATGAAAAGTVAEV